MNSARSRDEGLGLVRRVTFWCAVAACPLLALELRSD